MTSRTTRPRLHVECCGPGTGSQGPKHATGQTEACPNQSAGLDAWFGLALHPKFSLFYFRMCHTLTPGFFDRAGSKNKQNNKNKYMIMFLRSGLRSESDASRLRCANNNYLLIQTQQHSSTPASTPAGNNMNWFKATLNLKSLSAT